MVHKIYDWLHKKMSPPEEREEYSAGFWQNKIRQGALSLCRDIGDGRLLEVGCGEGLFIKQIIKQNPSLQIWGVDNSAKRLQDTQGRFNGEFAKKVHLTLQDATNLNFADEYFDAVVCINVLFNLGSLETIKKALIQLKRVCKKSGKIIFDFRNALNPFLVIKYKLARYYDDTLTDLNFQCVTPKQINAMLKELNLKVLKKVYISPMFFKELSPIILIKAQN
jgi:ubiquinone/menaquinone biosynthesis C-methylase UbiE